MSSGYYGQPDPAKRSMLLTALFVAQEQYGYLSQEAVQRVSERLNMSPGQVMQTASFYKMFHTEPVGRYVVQVCEGLSCHLAGGAETLLDYIGEKLGISPGETTEDGMFSLETVPCLAACDASPAMRINDTLHKNLTPADVDALLDDLRERA